MKFNNNYINLWNHLSSKRKKMFVFLMVLILISSFAEVFAIGSIIPFISILTSPEVVLKNIYLNKILLFFGISKGENINLFLSIIFIFAAIFAGSTRLLLLWTTTKISFATGSDLSIEIYRKTLYQPYLVHTSRNSSEVVTGILIKSKRMIGSVFLPIINIITAVVLALVIAVFLVLLDPGIISFIFLSLGIIYFFLALIVKKRLQLNGIIEAKQHSSVMKHLQDGLGGIRDILLNSNQNFYADIYKDSDKKLRNASAITTFTAQSPKYFFETIGMVLIASIAYIFSLEKGGITNSLPILGAIAVGAQRILPMMQQAYQSWANLKSSSKILSDVLELLDQPYPSYSILPKPNQLDFSDKIEFRKISFK